MTHLRSLRYPHTVGGEAPPTRAELEAGLRGASAAVITLTEWTDADLVAVPGDIADPATARRVTEHALERFGRIDTLRGGEQGQAETGADSTPVTDPDPDPDPIGTRP